MTPEAQRIAIAEACGWKNLRPHITSGVSGTVPHLIGDHIGVKDGYVPHYDTDLNAMHEAEKVLTPYQRSLYAEHLIRSRWPNQAPSDDLSWEQVYFAIHATARQRAEAFLRTIGKWQD